MLGFPLTASCITAGRSPLKRASGCVTCAFMSGTCKAGAPCAADEAQLQPCTHSVPLSGKRQTCDRAPHFRRQ